MENQTVSQWFNSLSGEEKMKAAKSRNAIVRHISYEQLPQAASFYQDIVNESFKNKQA